MIRGVSRYSVEIKGTGSPYFERAICFVRPEYARAERVDLHRAALEMIDRLSGEVEESGTQSDPADCAPRRRLLTILPLVISGLTGAAAAFLICLLLQ